MEFKFWHKGSQSETGVSSTKPRTVPYFIIKGPKGLDVLPVGILIRYRDCTNFNPMYWIPSSYILYIEIAISSTGIRPTPSVTVAKCPKTKLTGLLIVDKRLPFLNISDISYFKQKRTCLNWCIRFIWTWNKSILNSLKKFVIRRVVPIWK